MSRNPFKSKKYARTKIYKVRPHDIAKPRVQEEERSNIPKGIMKKCPSCCRPIYTKLLIQNNSVCDECGYHFRMSPKERFKLIMDGGEILECNKDLTTDDPLNFPGYGEKLAKAQEQTGEKEGVVTGKGSIKGIEVMVAVMDSAFIMGSMGTATGEKIVRLFEQATNERLPVIIFTASGGARMQEGIFSLMQMAKISGAVAKHDDAGLLYVTVLTDPTTGGVTASFAMLGDIILAEPGALIGFAGPRVIEQTIGQKLPEGFQRSEFLLDHGFVDHIVARDVMRTTLGRILRIHS